MNQTIYTLGHPETLIKEYAHWVILLRLEQTTIGSLIIAVKSEKEHLGDLSEEEWAEFAIVTKETENLLRKTFNAEKFNYLALMMFEPHIHFHVIPRYSKPVMFDGSTYTDPDWPNKTELKVMEISEDRLRKMKELMISNL